MPFDTFCLPLKKFQKVQNTTFCLHFDETKTNKGLTFVKDKRKKIQSFLHAQKMIKDYHLEKRKGKTIY